LQELRDYSAYKDRLQRVNPEAARSEADLDRIA